jgi:phosphoribosylpyrophosphate synthetase
MANNKIPAEIEEALDLLIGYVQDTEYDDYEERVEMGESVKGHVYVLASRLSDYFFPAED